MGADDAGPGPWWSEAGLRARGTQRPALFDQEKGELKKIDKNIAASRTMAPRSSGDAGEGGGRVCGQKKRISVWNGTEQDLPLQAGGLQVSPRLSAAAAVVVSYDSNP